MALVGAPALAGLNRAFATERKQGKLGVVLVGLGRFSTISIAPELAQAKHVYLAGVVTGSPDTKGREWARQYGFPETNIYSYDTFDRIADNPEIDVVHVVLPNGMHAEYTIRAAKAGKHVMVEKPMAISSAECEAMITACQQAKVALGVNYRLHFEPHHLELIRLMREKKFGALRAMTAEFSGRAAEAKPWLLDHKLAGGGAAFDTGVYPIQAGCYLTGETPTHASAIATSTRDLFKPGVEETMSFTLEFPGGAVMQARSSYAGPAQQLTLVCERSSVMCTALPEGGSPFGQSMNGKVNQKQIVTPRTRVFKADDTLQLAVLHDEFALSVRDQRAFACPGEMGLRDVRILESLYASVAQGGKRVTIAT